MTPEEFRDWRKAMGWSRAHAAEALGISASSIDLYELGRRRDDARPVEIPKIVAMATTFLSLEREFRARAEEDVALLETLKAGQIGTVDNAHWIASLESRIKANERMADHFRRLSGAPDVIPVRKLVSRP